MVRSTMSEPGSPLRADTRQQLESRFRRNLSGVRVHNDRNANESARVLGADAYTYGSHIAFARGRYAPHSAPGQSLLAHEIAHVLQQGRTTQIGVDGDVPVAPSDSNAEREAHRAAAAFGAGGPVPAITQSAGNVIYRAVETHGGSWDTTTYTPINDGAGVGKRVGAHIELEFTPNSLVVADNIGLTQTVKTLRNDTAGRAVDVPSPPSARKGTISLTTGDVGRAIDQGDPGDRADTIPNTNPLYAVENSAANISATLTDVGADARFGRHGHRIRRPNGTFDTDPAQLRDRPRRTIAFVGQEWRQTFEATALVLDGPMRNTYLGSIEWGWRVNAAGNASLDPNPIRLVRAGVPTSDFMEAAAVWNAATFTDPTSGTVHDTVDLPTTSGAVLGSGMDIARNRNTRYLLSRIAVVEDEIAGVATGAELVNKRFERRALVTELLRRSAIVDIKVNSTEDWLGADEVYVKLSSTGGTYTSRTRSMNDGASHRFRVPLRRLWKAASVGDPIHITVYDEDLGHFPDQDDLIVRMQWRRPFLRTPNTRSFDGADYDVVVDF